MGQPRVRPSYYAPLSGQPGYDLRVANFSKPHTPEYGTGTDSNPTKTRLGFRFQNTSVLASGVPSAPVVVATLTGSTWAGTPTSTTGSVTIADNDFTTGRAEVRLGVFVLVAGQDFTVGGSTAITATNLAAAIDRLADYAAVAVGSAVNVTGPRGSQPIRWETKVYGTIANFSTLTPAGGFLAPGTPALQGPAVIVS